MSRRRESHAIVARETIAVTVLAVALTTSIRPPRRDIRRRTRTSRPGTIVTARAILPRARRRRKACRSTYRFRLALDSRLDDRIRRPSTGARAALSIQPLAANDDGVRSRI